MNHENKTPITNALWDGAMEVQEPNLVFKWKAVAITLCHHAQQQETELLAATARAEAAEKDRDDLRELLDSGKGQSAVSMLYQQLTTATETIARLTADRDGFHNIIAQGMAVIDGCPTLPEHPSLVDGISMLRDQLATITAERDALLRRIGTNETAELLTKAVEAQCEETARVKEERDSFRRLFETETISHSNCREREEVLKDKLQGWLMAAKIGHDDPCTLGELCPYCEIDRLNQQLVQIIAERDEARNAKTNNLWEQWEIERGQMLAENTELKLDWSGKQAALITERDSALARETAMREDKARLDWLEKYYLFIDEHTCRQSLRGGILGITFNTASQTLRAAIDAEITP